MIQCLESNTDPATNPDPNTQNADDGSGSNNATDTASFTKAQADEIKANRISACEDVSFQVQLYTDSEMASKREEFSNAFVDTVDLLLDVYTNADYMKLIDIKLIFMIIITILLVLTLISMIIFYVNICCCCCEGNEKNRSGCITCNLVVASLGLIGFAACCGLMVFYIMGVKDGMSEVNCSLHVLSDDIINGNNDLEKFLGFFNVSTIIKTYIVDFQTLIDNHKSNFQNIQGMALHSKAQNAFDSIDTFVQDFTDKKTHDADGGDTKTPLSISEALPLLKTQAEVEFKTTQDVCELIHSAAETGYQQTNNPDTDAVKKSLEDVAALIDGFSKVIYDSFGTLSSNYGYVDQYYDIGQLSFIIFSFSCLGIGIAIYVSLCCALKKNKCTKFCCCRVIIAVLGTFTFLFMIFAFSMGTLTFATSASCGLLQQFTTKEGIDKFIDLFKLDQQMTSILETCLLETGTGKLNSIFTPDPNATMSSSTTFEQVEILLSVFDQYNDQLNSLDPDNNSLTIKAFYENLLTIKSGEVPDHANIGAGLALINDTVSCSDEVYVFSSPLCPSTGTCKVIETINTYDAPSCQTDSAKNQAASDMLIKLKVYYPETVQLMTELIDNSWETVNTTPNKLYKNLLADFRTAIDKFNLIKADLQDTLALMEENTIENGANCKIMRAEFQALEHAMCFKFVPNLFNFMIVSLVGSVLFFSFIWHFCCGTFCLERSGKHGEAAEFNEKIENDVFRPKYAAGKKYTYFEN
jgi:hypothetical protein